MTEECKLNQNQIDKVEEKIKKLLINLEKATDNELIYVGLYLIDSINSRKKEEITKDEQEFVLKKVELLIGEIKRGEDRYKIRNLAGMIDTYLEIIPDTYPAINISAKLKLIGVELENPDSDKEEIARRLSGLVLELLDYNLKRTE